MGNKKSKGEYTEALFVPKFMAMGYAVSIPFGNNQRYDLIIDNGRLFKVQCKTAWYYKGCIIFSVCSTNGFNGQTKSYHGEVDYFAVYWPEKNKYYLVPIDHVGVKATYLRIEPTKNNNTKMVRWASNYEI